MMGQVMVAVGYAAAWVDGGIQFAPEHERDDSRDVRLIGGHLEIEHQLGVLFPAVWNADRSLRQSQRGGRVLRLDALDALLDISNGVEILGNARAIGRAQR